MNLSIRKFKSQIQNFESDSFHFIHILFRIIPNTLLILLDYAVKKDKF